MGEDSKKTETKNPENPADAGEGQGGATFIPKVVEFRSVWIRIRQFLIFRPEAGAFFAAVVVFLIFSLVAENFLTIESISSILTLATEAGIVCLGVTFLIIGGEFDLSVGSIWGLSAVLVPIMINVGVPVWVAILVSLSIAVAIGLLQGMIIIKVGLPSFIVTLGGMMWWRGCVYVFTGGFPIAVEREAPLFKIFSYRFENNLSVAALWFFGLAVIMSLILKRTQFGNWIYATGGKKLAARQLGVPVNRVKLTLFGLTAGMAGLTGIIQMTRFLSIDALRGERAELNAIAAVAIGGTRLFGGYGSIAGTVFGVLMVAMIQNGLVLSRVPGYWFEAFVGLVIVVAVIINTSTEKRALRGTSSEE